MTFQSLVDNLVYDTLDVSLPLYWPEMVLCATIVILLLARLVKGFARVDPFLFALVGAIAALALSAPVGGFAALGELQRTELFTGMLVYDGLTVFLRLVLLFFAVLLIVLAKLTGLADRDDGQDFYVLLLGATLGMCIMASANHLLTVFLGVEMASVPSYVLVGIVKGSRRAGEAALKYAVYGAGAAGVMLYGVSLIVGLLGTAHLPTIGLQLAALDLPGMIAEGQEFGTLSALVLAGLMIGVGLAFKLSAVPFHFWCPDAFAGGTAEVAGFLSVASKAAALALLVRITLAVCAPQTDLASLAPVQNYVAIVIGVIAAVTCTFGNLAAFGQTNIKRLLAYSTIAHAGYMMMPVAAVAFLSGDSPGGAEQAVASLLIYIGVYLFMNLAAFAIVAFLRNAMGSEEIDDYGGLIHAAPVTTVCLVVIMASLLGIPPLAGFLGKFAAFAVLAKAGTPLMLTLLVIAGVNTVISLVYYWRVVRTMCLRPEPATRGPIAEGLAPVVYSALVTLPLFLLFLFPAGLTNLARDAAAQLLPGTQLLP
ncbi:MAG: NADH-quinone oxidoreductase subunit N [Aeoliella sp.]